MWHKKIVSYTEKVSILDPLRKTFLLAWVGIFFAFQQVFESNNSSIACCLSGASVPDKQSIIIYDYSAERQT